MPSLLESTLKKAAAEITGKINRQDFGSRKFLSRKQADLL
jgi:hypothetical protein